MNKLLYADNAGPVVQKLYHNSAFALAALVPATLVSPQDGVFAKIADIGLAAAIPLHNHVALNYGARAAVSSAAELFESPPPAIPRCLMLPPSHAMHAQ